MSALFSSLQTLSGKMLDVIRGSGGQESTQNKSIEEDLKWLRRVLKRIEAVQHDAEDREIHDESVALYLKELRGVAHEAEDVLDDFHYEVLKSIVENRNTATETSPEKRETMMPGSSIGSKRKLEETLSSHASSSSGVFKILASGDMGDKIKTIKDRFEEICNHHEHLHLTADHGPRRISAPQCRPPTSSVIDEKGLFGREKEKEEIISLLNVENDTDFMVVPIIGKGGLGKTTLAQLVYNDLKVCRLFDKKAWVSVSDDFDLVRLTKAIVESVTNSPCKFSELSKIQDILMENINGIKLFLVLDDIWNEEKILWERFKIVFNRARSLRILITTRNLSVAKIMQTTPPFELAQLHEDKCWMLFKHSVFGNQEENEHADLLEIGRHIVKKCNGLPLAVKVLGGLLGYETSEEKWKDILEMNTWEADEIIPTLSLSYHHMPLHLRPCFLYLSFFPKDHEFKKKLVIKLWMAQGYINSRPNKTLEDIGGEYFEELRCRSLVDSLYEGTYQLHDLIHDLARSIDKNIYPTSMSDKTSDGSFHGHHIYLDNNNELLEYITPNNIKYIRSLWNYGLYINPIVQVIDPSIYCSMISLRALGLETNHSAFMFDISIFKHLRYLSFYGEELEYFPEELCFLYNLQTLDAVCHDLKELPSDIGNLINLRYLSILSDYLEKLPDSISYLCNLQQLELDAYNMDELPSGIEQITNLRRLKLSSSRSGIKLPRGLGKLTHLQTTEGKFSFNGDAIEGGLGEFKLIDDLRGSLCIEGIENITDVKYIREANLKSKSNLYCLILDFRLSNRDEEDDGYKPKLYLKIDKSISMGHSTSIQNIEESMLDSLQPHGNIKELEIYNYGGTKWPSWISDPLQMSKLTLLYLGCIGESRCMCLLPLGRLPSLKSLYINGFSVKKIGNEFCRESDSSSNNAFLSLEKFVFYNMTKLKEWIGVLVGDFPCLKKLSIYNCPNLRNLPTITNELEKLVIYKCGFYEIQLLISHRMKNVTISDCDELTSVIGLNNYKSLTKLTIQNCPLLKISMDSLFLSLISEVDISNCAKFDIPGLGNIDCYQKNSTVKRFNTTWYVKYPESAFSLVCTNSDALRNHLHVEMASQTCVLLDMPILYELQIESDSYYHTNYHNMKKLFILGLRYLCHCKAPFMPEFLEHLEVSCCDEIFTIPPLVENSALREIRISKCPKLSSIEGLHLLSSLRNLFLEDCPQLRVLPCEKLRIGLERLRVYNCPLMVDWCQLNGFPENKDIRFLADGERSSSMVHSTRAYLTDGIGSSIMAERTEVDVEEDLDTSLHL